MLGVTILLQATLTIGVAGPTTSPEYLPVRVAEANGHFADAKVRVSLQTYRSSADAAEALASGRVDLAAISLDSALRLGHVHGVPPRLIYGLTAAPPVALLVPAGRAAVIRDLADLQGKTVGITAPGTAEAEALAALLVQARVRPERVTVASFGERRLAQALGTGEVAAALIGDPWATRLVREGQAAVLADLRQSADLTRWLGGETVHAAVFVSPSSRLAAPDLVPVARALLGASRRVRTAPPGDLAAGLEDAVVGAPEDFALRVEGARGIFIADGMVSPDALEDGIRLAQSRARLPVVVKLPRPLERLLFLEPLRQAQEALGRSGGAGLRIPQRPRSRRVVSTGSPTTLVRQPSTSATRRPPAPCTAYPPALSKGSPVAT
jgi:sulfonate transport system substrate-binding protein